MSHVQSGAVWEEIWGLPYSPHAALSKMAVASPPRCLWLGDLRRREETLAEAPQQAAGLLLDFPFR